MKKKTNPKSKNYSPNNFPKNQPVKITCGNRHWDKGGVHNSFANHINLL